MFNIIISEKGGAERRESFDKSEINVGRVQGNDLVLPKGNVSKHHARLLFRDGRFIVTDLKSTNGTYVNGRKIAQATIVRAGDKVYVGDYVMRIENSDGASVAPPHLPVMQPPETEQPTQAKENPVRAAALAAQSANIAAAAQLPGQLPGAGMVPNPSQAPGPLSPVAAPRLSAPPPGMPPLPIAGAGAAPLLAPLAAPLAAHGSFGARPGAPQNRVDLPPQRPQLGTIPQPGASEPGASGFGLGGVAESVAAPPVDLSPVAPAADANQAVGPTATPLRRPNLPRAQTAPMQGDRPGGEAPRRASMPPPAAPMHSAPPGRLAAGSIGSSSSATTGQAPPVQSAAAPPVAGAVSPPLAATAQPVSASRSNREPAVHAGRRLALIALQNRVASALDLKLILDPQMAAMVERVVREQAEQMRSDGDAPQGVDVDALVQEATRELLALGAFTAPMQDEQVSEIHASRFDHVVTVRGGARSIEPGFSSEIAMIRVASRLALEGGAALDPQQPFTSRRLPSGAVLSLTLPPLSTCATLSVRKRKSADRTLEEFVRGGALSRSMVVFLEAAAAVRANILVFAPWLEHATDFAASLCLLGSGNERIYTITDDVELQASQGAVVSMAADPTSVRAAAHARADRILVTASRDGVFAATLDMTASGTQSVAVAAVGSTLRQGFSRLVSQVVLSRPGLANESARECLADCFDLAIELAVGNDGRARVARIAELSGSDAKGIVSRDIFVQAPDGAGDAGFMASGVVPRLANECAARGILLDQNVFKRAAR